MYRNIAHLGILLILLSTTLISQISQQWVSKYQHISSANDIAKYSQLDNGRNIYITGLSDGNFLVTKYNSSGDKLWVSKYTTGDNNEDDFLSGFKVDDNRNVYITGSILTSDTTYDIVTIKYNTNGVQQWAAQYGGGYKIDDIAVGLDVDPSGNVYVVGYNYNPATQNDFVLIRYNSNGVEQWVRRCNGIGNGDDFPVGITIDGLKNVYVTGNSYNPSTFIDYLTVKYDSTGFQQWAVSYDGIGFDEDIPSAIGIDNYNNIYVAGSSYGDTSDVDFAVVKYNPNGVPVWVARYNSPANDADVPSAIKVTLGGDIFVTGYMYDYISSYNYLTVKFNADGTLAWSAIYNSVYDGDDFATSLVVDPSQNVYVTGSVTVPDGNFQINTIKYDGSGAQQWMMPYSQSTGNNTEANGVLLDPLGGLTVIGTGFTAQNANDILALRYTTGGTLSWTRSENELTQNSYDDYPNAMMNDNLGNTYVVGASYDDGTLFDYITIKYNSNGDTLWSVRYDGDFHDNDEAVSIGIDQLKNVYVTGTSYSMTSKDDIVTIKYNQSGVVQWSRSFNGPKDSTDRAVDLATDSSGNVYIVGYTVNISGDYDIVTLKYNTDGVIQWATIFNSSNQQNDYPSKIRVDNSGNVYVTGYCTTSISSNNFVTIKYNSNGVQQWARYYNGSANDKDVATALALDGLGNVYVTGSSTGLGSLTDIVTLKYSPSGVQLWERRYNGPANSTDCPKSIAVLSSGEVYVGGWSFGIGTFTDVLILKYSSSGNLLWENRYNGESNDYDYLEDMFVDNSGNTYASVTSGNTASSNDFVALKYNASGIQQWLTKYSNSFNSSDEVRAIKVDSLGNIFVTGAVYDLSDYSDILTLKYRQTTYISGTTFYDNNNNGAKDADDPPLSGWKIYLIGLKKDSVLTDLNGKYIFTDVPFGSYIVNQSKKVGWSQTLPLSSSYPPFSVGLANLSYVFDFGNYSADAHNYSLDGSWNIVSVPLQTLDTRKSIIFSTATSSAFFFQNGYHSKDTLQNLAGYWLKFAATQGIWIAGTQFTRDTIDVNIGWNLIGSVSIPVSLNSVTTVPSGIIQSSFYGYKNGYSIPDSLRPIKGYWVKVSQAGKLIVASGAPLSNSTDNALALLRNLNKLIIKDKEHNSTTLYFGDSSNVLDFEKYSLPPAPPVGIFDARFENDCFVFDQSVNSKNGSKILISTSEYPITLSWEILEDGKSGFELVGGKSGNTEYDLEGAGNIELSSKDAANLVLKYVGHEDSPKIPNIFALNQNYPNPFNPTTEIKYQLPIAIIVGLKIYNILGQEVAVLVNEMQAPGYKSIKWDAANQPSGIYIYKISAGKYSEVKKMILLK